MWLYFDSHVQGLQCYSNVFMIAKNIHYLSSIHSNYSHYIEWYWYYVDMKQCFDDIDSIHMHCCDVTDGYCDGSASYLQLFLMFVPVFAKKIKYYEKNALINIQKYTKSAFQSFIIQFRHCCLVCEKMMFLMHIEAIEFLPWCNFANKNTKMLRMLDIPTSEIYSHTKIFNHTIEIDIGSLSQRATNQ